ncbi:MAG TPA: hypothetical protein EYO33_30690, partial [Phycisphaerales bacterium]|nr:hypothetical protein [Phycisphaerales bacterium]
MRNAKKDRAIVQSGYGADAALRYVMNELQTGTAINQISRDPVDMGGGWQYKVDDIVALGTEEFRVSTSGLLRGKVKRKAVAIIDDG